MTEFVVETAATFDLRSSSDAEWTETAERLEQIPLEPDAALDELHDRPPVISYMLRRTVEAPSAEEAADIVADAMRAHLRTAGVEPPDIEIRDVSTLSP